MKTTLYSLLLFLFLCTSFAEAQKVYKGKVNVFQQTLKKKDGKLLMEMEVSVCGISVGTQQSLLLLPMLKAGRDSLVMQPIVINGTNKQEMYNRAVALKGKVVADDGAFLVIKNDPGALIQFTYTQEVVYRKWMEEAGLLLVGQFCNYNGDPKQTFIDTLTDKIRIDK